MEIFIDHNIGHVAGWFNEMSGDTDTLVDKILLDSSIALVRAHKKRFTTQLDPDGKPWKPPRESTLRGRKKGKGRAGRGGKALVSTGEMKKNFVPERTGKDRIRIRQTMPYAKYHATGFKSKITSKQAWWMTINLFGYDPDKPWKFGEKKFDAIHQKIIQKKNKKNLTPFGQQSAYVLWKNLIGKTLTVPQRKFMGINQENVDEIEKIASRLVLAFIKRGRMGSMSGG